MIHVGEVDEAEDGLRVVDCGGQSGHSGQYQSLCLSQIFDTLYTSAVNSLFICC